MPALTADLFGAAEPYAAPGQRGGWYDTPARPAARVNGEVVPAREVERLVAVEMARERAGLGEGAYTVTGLRVLEERERELRRACVDLLIDRRLALQEAARLGVMPSEEDIRQRWHERREDPRAADAGDPWTAAQEEATIQALRRRAAREAGDVPPEAVRRYYRDHAADFRRPRRLAVRGLVLFRERAGRDDPRPASVIAEAIAAALEKGERFDDLARRHSEFPFPHGTGELLPESAWAEPVREALRDLRPGAVAGPVDLAGAVAFCKLDDRRASEPAPFDEVADAIRRELRAKQGAEAFRKWLAALRASAVVEYAEGFSPKEPRE